jgi:hypothetical protein
LRYCLRSMSQVDGGFAATFKEAVGRWRRRHRHPPPGETWFAVHYRLGWLVEKLTFLESVHLLRQGLDVRPLSSERPPKRRKEAGAATTAAQEDDDEEGIHVEDEPQPAVNSERDAG